MIKLLYRIGLCWKITKKDTLSPLFEKSQFFQLLTIPIFLLLAFMAGDLTENLFSLSQTFTAIVLTIPIWFVINLILSPFRMLKEEKDLGAWIGDQFIFHEKKLIKTLAIQPFDNETEITVKIPDIPKKTIVRYKIEYHGGLAKVQHSIFMAINFDVIQRDKQSGGFLYKTDPKFLIHCPQNSDQTIARIYLISWEVSTKRNKTTS